MPLRDDFAQADSWGGRAAVGADTRLPVVGTGIPFPRPHNTEFDVASLEVAKDLVRPDSASAP